MNAGLRPLRKLAITAVPSIAGQRYIKVGVKAKRMFLFLEQGQAVSLPLIDLVQNVTHGKRAVASAKAPAVAIDKNGRYPIDAEVDGHILEGIV